MKKVIIKNGRVVEDKKKREQLTKEQQDKQFERICIVLENYLNNLSL